MSRYDIVQLFRVQDQFLLLIHHSPDGDAIASSLALGMALQSMGKVVDIVCADPIPKQFQFLPGARAIKRDFFLGDYNVVVTLDCGDSRRTGFSARLKELLGAKKKLHINIDHHPKNDLHALASHNFVDSHAPSTSYLVYDLIHGLSVPLDYKLATCLLTGLYTDTGGFRHPNTTSDSLTFASLLLSYGARLKDITRHITHFTTVPRLRLWGLALSRIQQHHRLDIVSTFITHEDITTTGASESDIAGIAALMTSIPAGLAILIIQSKNQTVQVRIRTKQKHVNVAQLAAYLGGGGQRRSAGFSLEGSFLIQSKDNRT